MNEENHGSGQVKVIRPGDPDFESIAASITRPERIRKGLSFSSANGIAAPTVRVRNHKNKDTVNKLRG